MTTIGYSEAGIEKQIRDAQEVLDETHVEMGGTGKRISELEARIQELEKERDAARHGWNECEKLGNYQFDQSRKQVVGLRNQVSTLQARVDAGDRLRDEVVKVRDYYTHPCVTFPKLYAEIAAYDALKTATSSEVEK